MEFDELKSLWTAIEPPAKTDKEVRNMLKENNHPVLKGIRKQCTMEIVGWVVFLTCYYSMFDGSSKPVLVNFILIVAVLTPLMHNIYGYNFAKHLVYASSIRESLEKYLRRMKRYMIRSIVSRIVFLCGLMLFFTANISFGSRKYLLLSAMTLLLLLIQTIFLYSIWTKRIAAIRTTLIGLS